MIRDPSDGSIRDQHGWCCGVPEEPYLDSLSRDPPKGRIETGPVIDTSTSGLPITKAKAAYLARLEESRKWLKSYVRPTIKG